MPSRESDCVDLTVSAEARGTCNLFGVFAFGWRQLGRRCRDSARRVMWLRTEHGFAVGAVGCVVPMAGAKAHRECISPVTCWVGAKRGRVPGLRCGTIGSAWTTNVARVCVGEVAVVVEGARCGTGLGAWSVAAERERPSRCGAAVVQVRAGAPRGKERARGQADRCVPGSGRRVERTGVGSARRGVCAL